jgi:ferritin-like metal-binding protein YciE
MRSAAQAVEYYEITCKGMLITFARRVGRDNVARVQEKTQR